MSFRTELQELVKWISELRAKDEPKPKPVPKEDWQAVDRLLKTASAKFSEADVALRGKDPPFLAEIARDLAREAEALALRAHLLSRRAPPKTETPKKRRLRRRRAATATSEPHKEQKPRGPADLVRSAGDTVETAHQRLEAVKPPDVVTKAFEAELDVLAEMTLSLRQRCGAPNAEPSHAEVVQPDERSDSEVSAPDEDRGAAKVAR